MDTNTSTFQNCNRHLLQLNIFEITGDYCATPEVHLARFPISSSSQKPVTVNRFYPSVRKLIPTLEMLFGEISKLRIVSHSDAVILRNYTGLNNWTQKRQTA